MPAPGSKVRADRGQGREVTPGRTIVVTGDFETYHDKDYSLKKLSTSEYVRDKRFEAVCLALKVGDGETKVYFGHKEIQKALDKIDWGRAEFLAHHTHFDGLILTHHFGKVPVRWRDTLSMSRALHPTSERNDLDSVAIRYGEKNKLEMPDFKGKRLKDLTQEERAKIAKYAGRDTDIAASVYAKMVEKMPEAEMELIDITVRMFAEPVMRLDTKLAKSELAREIQERATAIASSGAKALAGKIKLLVKPKKKGDSVTEEHYLSSNKAFPQLLRAAGVEPPTKTSKTTGKQTYALAKSDEDFTDLLAHPAPAVVALVKGRLAAKSTIGETRAARLLKSGSGGKRLPVYLKFCGAHTTRWSGGDKLNYQNFKKKGELRKAILAPAGYQLVVIDSKTIEARVLAWLANEEWLLEAFRNGFDPYVLFAEDIYGRKIDPKVDKLERFISKSCVLGLGYQMGGPKLQVSILASSINAGLEPVRLDLPVCYDLVSKYRRKNEATVDLWDFMQNEVISHVATGRSTREYKGLEYGRGFVRLKGHLALLYPEMRAHLTDRSSGWTRSSAPARVTDASYRSAGGRTKIYGGMMTENVVQYLARIIVAEQMRQIAQRYRVVMMTHDEVVFLAPTRTAQAALDWGLQVMQTPPLWAPDLPVGAEGGFDSCYSK